MIAAAVLAEPYSIVNIKAGPFNTCVSLNTGILHCWGKADNNINSVPIEFGKHESQQLFSYDLAISLEFACGIKVNKQLAIYQLKCWGQCAQFDSIKEAGEDSTCTVPKDIQSQA